MKKIILALALISLVGWSVAILSCTDTTEPTTSSSDSSSRSCRSCYSAINECPSSGYTCDNSSVYWNTLSQCRSSSSCD